jgi:hypothetical protein
MDECPPTASLESRGSDAIMAAHDNTLAMTITENRKSLRRDDVKNAVPRRLGQSGLDHWSRRFARLVTGSSPTGWPPGEVVGLEHEYRLTYDARAVDFRTIVHSLDLGRPLLDPADLNAYRLASGAALTADEAEAEIALAPSLVRPGCGLRIADAARSERQALEARLPKEAHLKGYSTHLSVAVCPSSSAAMAKLYLSSFSAALMLLMDSISSPGLLVRPRPCRLELGGEFVDGDRLVVAIVFALGSVRACQRQLDSGARHLDPNLALCLDVQSDDQRYGWFVGRTAFGSDLYRGGREAWLRLKRGSPITAQTHLERCWTAARATVLDDVDPDEIALVDKVVHGAEPLPARAPSLEERSLPWREDTSRKDDDLAQAFGFASRAHSRPGYDLAPVMLTWDRAVFVVSGPRRDRVAFALVPAPLLANFSSQLTAGALDETVTSYLGLWPRRRRLGRVSATAGPGLYDHLEPRSQLLVPERDPRSARWITGRLATGTIRRGRHGTAGFGASATGSGGHL